MQKIPAPQATAVTRASGLPAVKQTGPRLRCPALPEIHSQLTKLQGNNPAMGP